MKTRMQIVSQLAELNIFIEEAISQGCTIGFVPTMGALHAGHLSLVSASKLQNDVTVVSIFVNPTQFNNPTDLAKYPRDIHADTDMLAQAGVDLVFAPEVNEMYSEWEQRQTFNFDFEGLDAVMEGKFRPGHFNGVVQVVSKLFSMVPATRAYFGEKDFQQLAIIQLMSRKLGYKTAIIPCPIMREPSGLAMSSRNERLSSDERLLASEISHILFQSRLLVSMHTPASLCKWVEFEFSKHPALTLEYFEIADAATLQQAIDWTKPSVGCVAAYCGGVRLIDNVRYS